jgi:hypothetical protein
MERHLSFQPVAARHDLSRGTLGTLYARMALGEQFHAHLRSNKGRAGTWFGHAAPEKFLGRRWRVATGDRRVVTFNFAPSRGGVSVRSPLPSPTRAMNVGAGRRRRLAPAPQRWRPVAPRAAARPDGSHPSLAACMSSQSMAVHGRSFAGHRRATKACLLYH